MSLAPAGHSCGKYQVVAVVLWDAFEEKANYLKALFSTIPERIVQDGKRGCQANKEKECVCQNQDKDTASLKVSGLTVTVGCTKKKIGKQKSLALLSNPPGREPTGSPDTDAVQALNL